MFVVASASFRLLRIILAHGDHDASYGSYFCNRVEAMGIKQVVMAARSPWQNAYVQRVIGSIRRECLDHIVILNERHLSRVLSSYVDYYHADPAHISCSTRIAQTFGIAASGESSPSRKSVACIIATNGRSPDLSRIPAHQSLHGGRTPSSEHLRIEGFAISLRGKPLVVRIAARLV
jgi:transposase InsO family protein